MSTLAEDVRKLHRKLAKTDPEKARMLREGIWTDPEGDPYGVSARGRKLFDGTPNSFWDDAHKSADALMNVLQDAWHASSAAQKAMQQMLRLRPGSAMQRLLKQKLKDFKQAGELFDSGDGSSDLMFVLDELLD